MATFLHRIGQGAFKRRWLVLLLWVVLLGAAGAAAANSSGTSNSNITLPGVEAQKAFDLLEEKFPAADSTGASARIVLKAPDGEKLTSDDQKAKVARLLQDVHKSSPGIAQVTDPFTGGAVSADGTTGYAQVTYEAQAGDLTEQDHHRLDQALDEGRDQGLTVEASGNALAPAEVDASSEVIGFALAAIILVITFGSLAAAGMPLLTALIGVGITGSAVTALTATFDLSSSTSALATMLGVAVTLVPALLAFAPQRALGRKARKERAVRETDEPRGKKPLGERWADFILRRPLKVLLVAVLGLVVVGLPAAKLELGLPDDSSQPMSTTQRKAYDMLADAFGPGFNGPLTLVVTDPSPDTAHTAAAELTRDIQQMPDVAAVAPAAFNPQGDTATITVVPKSAPAGDSTKDLVHDIRELAHDADRTSGAQALVTGTTALNIDVSAKFTSAIVPYLALVVGLAFLVLVLVFRSVVVPLKAALGFLLSVLAAFGALVAVFQWGWFKDLFGLETTGPIMSLMPILTVGIVFGLAMDYQVFLVTRIREAYVHGADPRKAITDGFRHSGRVVTVAALIMTAVFAGFIGAGGCLYVVRQGIPVGFGWWGYAASSTSFGVRGS